jgi:hypothetical protein
MIFSQKFYPQIRSLDCAIIEHLYVYQFMLRIIIALLHNQVDSVSFQSVKYKSTNQESDQHSEWRSHAGIVKIHLIMYNNI